MPDKTAVHRPHDRSAASIQKNNNSIENGIHRLSEEDEDYSDALSSELESEDELTASVPSLLSLSLPKLQPQILVRKKSASPMSQPNVMPLNQPLPLSKKLSHSTGQNAEFSESKLQNDTDRKILSKKKNKYSSALFK
jgi:hypothetical protein